MKKLKIILLIIGLANLQMTHAQKTIQLQVTGVIETSPDIAIVYFNINDTQKDLKTLQQNILKLNATFLNDLKSIGIDKKDIQTNQLNTNKDYSWENNSQVFKGYQANISHKVIFRKIENLNEIYTKILLNKNTQLNGITYDIENKKNIEEDAYVLAIQKATAIAQKIIKEIGATSMSITNINNVQAQNTNPIYQEPIMLRNAKTEDHLPIEINSGQITITQSLYITFQYQ